LSGRFHLRNVAVQKHIEFILREVLLKTQRYAELPPKAQAPSPTDDCDARFHRVLIIPALTSIISLAASSRKGRNAVDTGWTSREVEDRRDESGDGGGGFWLREFSRYWREPLSSGRSLLFRRRFFALLGGEQSVTPNQQQELS